MGRSDGAASKSSILPSAVGEADLEAQRASNLPPLKRPLWGLTAPGAGQADILLVPTYEVGNGIGKAMSLFGGAKNAGIILGAKVPVVLVSRADSAESKLASIALGAVTAGKV